MGAAGYNSLMSVEILPIQLWPLMVSGWVSRRPADVSSVGQEASDSPPRPRTAGCRGRPGSSDAANTGP